jgi:hypothetical protein
MGEVMADVVKPTRGTGMSRWLLRSVAGLGAVVFVAQTGCQTYPAGFGGMTLPSPHYLKHYPQYFPPDPAFPLQRELDSMQAAELAPLPGRGALPAPLPGVPGALGNPTPLQPGGAAPIPPGVAVPPPGGGK